jgi:GNAT superfamily N-acetyltransferase
LPAHCQQVRELIAEYIAWDSERTRQLGLDVQEFLDFQYGQREEAIPGVYSPPDGCLLLATYSGQPAGCGAFRKISSEICEMKRLYVRPEYRGKQIGRQLATILITTAREVGYGVMRLETVRFMEGALTLYPTLGFRICEPYYVIPDSFRDITLFMELDLRSSR